MTYVSVEMLPAAHGDCLWVEWDDSDGLRRRMLIDGGPAHTYPALYERVQQLSPEDRRLDLLVVTHIDADHIDGIIRLLLDRAALGLDICRLWFNGRSQLDAVPGILADDLGAMSGEYLGLLAAELADEGTDINGGFDHPWIGVDREADEHLPTVDLPGLRITLLSPDIDRLLALSDAWTEAMEAAGIVTGDDDALRNRLANDPRLRPLADVLGEDLPPHAVLPDELGGDADPGSDTSVANGSSIAFLADFGPAHNGEAEVRYLFAGDAFASVLRTSLERWCGDHGDVNFVPLDGFKIPHHGSIANVTRGLLNRLRTRRYLISTSGAQFGHPHETAVDLLVDRHGRGKPDLVFNYASDTTAPFADRADARTHYPTGTTVSHTT